MKLLMALTVLAIGGSSQALYAQVVSGTACLDGGQEVPPNASPATGFGTFSLDTNANTLAYDISYGGLLGVVTAAHFHLGDCGVVGPIQLGLPTNNPIVGTVGLTSAQVTAAAAGDWYINIHTTAFPGGEIRGTLDFDDGSDCVPCNPPVCSFDFSFGSSGGGAGQFDSPRGIAVSATGRVHVADTANHRIQVFGPTGIFLFAFGSNGSGDGQFSFPRGVAVDTAGRIYVADTFNHRIQVFDSTGAFLLKWGTNGSGDGQFDFPQAVRLAGTSEIYAADGNDRVQVFDLAGNFVRKFGSFGFTDGLLNNPHDVAVDSASRAFVADFGNHRVQVFDASGSFLFYLGSDNGGGGLFFFPTGVALDGDGRAYVSDSNNHRIQVFDWNGTQLSEFGSSGSGNGQFSDPNRILINGDRLYVTDTGNNRVQVFRCGSAATVPALGAPGLIALLAVLLGAGVVTIRKRARAAGL